MRRQTRSLALGAVWACAALGCGAGTDISLGALHSLSEADCGDDASNLCDASAPVQNGDGAEADAGTADTLLPLPEARRCAANAEGALEIAFQVMPQTAVCASYGACQLGFDQLEVAADGSLWVLGTLLHSEKSNAEVLAAMDARDSSFEQYIQQNLWLAHYAADGTQLGAAVSSGSVGQLAVDTRGVAWVLLNTDGRKPTRIERYDASVQALPSIPAPDPALFSFEIVATSDRMFLTGMNSSGQRQLFALDLDGALLSTVQVDRPQGDLGLTADVRSGAGAAHLARYWEANTLRLERRAADGSLLWSGLLGTLLDPGVGAVRLGSDALGNVTSAVDMRLADYPQPPQLPHCDASNCYAIDKWSWVERVSSAGEPQWLWQVDTNLNLGFAVSADGTVFVGGAEGNGPVEDAVNSIVEISADGSVCRKFSVNGVEGLNFLAVAPDGSLYFSAAFSLGRLKR